MHNSNTATMSSTALTFLGEFFKDPTKIGAVTQSSSALAHEIVNQAHVQDAKVIVELGAGTGTVTSIIVEESLKDSIFIAVELNKHLAGILRNRLPYITIYNDSAENLPKMLEECHVSFVDSIVSGLPWASFNETLQDTILDTAYNSLRPGGRFVTFAYLQGLLLPAGQSFAKKIRTKFSKVSKSRTIWTNFPPAFVYICEK